MSHRPLLLSLLLAGLVFPAGCLDVGTGATDEAAEQADTALAHGYCLAVARTLSGADEGGSKHATLQAAQEMLAQAPTQERSAARIVVEHLERAHAGDHDALEAEDFRAAAERLREAASLRCASDD